MKSRTFQVVFFYVVSKRPTAGKGFSSRRQRTLSIPVLFSFLLRGHVSVLPEGFSNLSTVLKNCSFCSSMSVFAASSAWHGMVHLACFAELSLYISLNAKLLVRLIRSPLVIVSLFSSYGNKCLQFRFTSKLGRKNNNDNVSHSNEY